jgi:hypothetical protein
MGKAYSIHIEGLETPAEFVDKWAVKYTFGTEEKYLESIDHAFDDYRYFKELFLWKNGTGDQLSKLKQKVVDEYWEKKETLIDLRIAFDWNKFETTFNPESNSTIWKIFLLHIVNPSNFPIFDQHVYRSYNFFQHGTIQEISERPKEIYQFYKNDYILWFNSLKKEYQLNYKMMDQAFWAFGKLLKNLKDLPIEKNN